MTTTKARLTLYLGDPQALEDLYRQVRTLAPLEARGRVSRSTIVEACISLALKDVETNKRESAVFKTVVTSPPPEDHPEG